MRKILAIILSLAVILSMTIVSMPAAMASGTITGDTYIYSVVDTLPAKGGWTASEGGGAFEVSATAENNVNLLFYGPAGGAMVTPGDTGVKLSSISSWCRLYLNYGAPAQTGIVTYEIKGNFKGQKPSKFDYYVGHYSGDPTYTYSDASWYGFENYMTDISTTEEKEYTIKLVVDTNAGKMTGWFNGQKCDAEKFGRTFAGGKNAGVKQVYFDIAGADFEFTLTDVNIYYEKNTPKISSISYVKDGTEVAESDWVSGVFDENADEIKVYLTDAVSVDASTAATITAAGGAPITLAHSLGADGKSITLTLPDGKLANGDYTLSIANLLADGMVIANPLTDTFKVDAETVITANTYEVAVFDGLPETSAWKTDKGNYQSDTHSTVNGLKFNIFRGVDSGVDWAPVTVNADKTLTINATSYARLQMYYPVEADNGKVIYEIRGKFDKAPGKFMYNIKDAAGNTLIYTYSEWTGFETYVDDLTKEYAFTLEYDTDLGAMQLYLNGVAIENNMFRAEGLSKTGVGKPVYFEFVPASGGSQFTITGYKVALVKNTPQFDSLGYVLNGTEKNLKTGEKVPAVAKSIVLNYTGEVGSDIKTSVKLLKDGAEVSATYKTDGSKVIVTPADGFGNGNYTVSVSGLLVSAGRLGENFNVSKSFETESVFAIISPETDVLKNAENVKLAVSLPAGYTYENLLFFIDGEEQELPDENCSLTVASSDLAYGDHVFTAKLYEASDEDMVNPTDEISTRFELKNNKGSESDYSPSLTSYPNVIKCEGVDGSADGGVQINRSGEGAGFKIIGINNTSVLFVEADIKRAVGQGLKFESTNESSTDGNKWLFLGHIGSSQNIIGTDGSVAGNSNIKFPADEWHNLKLIYNTVTHQTDIYIDGKLALSGTNKDGEPKISLIKFYGIAGTADSPLPICFDNIRYGVYDVIPSVEEVSYTTAASSEAIKADGKKVSVLANTITLRLSRAFDALTANSVTVNGAAPSAVSVSSADSKVVTITPATALSEGDVNITFQSGLMLGGAPTDKAVQVLLETEGYLTDSVGDITFSADKKSASVKIIKAVSGSTLPESVDFIIAAYQGDRLMQINIENKPLSAENGENSLSVSLPADFSVEGLEVRAFIWNAGTLAPIK